MTTKKFILGQPVIFEETLFHEFKEIKGKNPVGSIKSQCDEYAVAFLNRSTGSIYWGIRNDDRVVVGVKLDYQQRDSVRRTIDEQIGNIHPSITPSSYRVQIHTVRTDVSGLLIDDLCVVELEILEVNPYNLYSTSNGDYFIKTESGRKKLVTQDQVFQEFEKRIRKRDLDIQNNKQLYPAPMSDKATRFTFQILNNGELSTPEKEMWAMVSEVKHLVSNGTSYSFYIVHEGLNELLSSIENLNNKDTLSPDERIWRVNLLRDSNELNEKVITFSLAIELLFNKQMLHYVSDPIEFTSAIKGISDQLFKTREFGFDKHQGFDIFRKDYTNIYTVIWVPRENLSHLKDHGIAGLFWGGGADLYDLGWQSACSIAIPAMLLEIVRLKQQKKKYKIEKLLVLTKWSIGWH